jgi:phospholipid/cholesterol/gamma-HCH transport system ATP-binding protein
VSTPAEHPRGGAHVDVISVRLAFGERRVFDGLSCRFSQGKVSVILGASGVGKSTLVRLIAGLTRPDYGDLWIGEQEISRLPERQLRKVRRRIGMMFQGGALLDSMTVFDNVALPLREHTELPEKEIAERVHAQFDAVGLKRVDALLPGELSGGMKKRAALARAMITEPEILLIDEPFSGLDPLAVRLIEALLREMNHGKGLTMILTNHHIGSTMRLADEIVFLSDGAAITGSVKEIKESKDPRIQRFLIAAGTGPLLEEAS